MNADLHRAPPLAALMGYGGLIPFFAGAAASYSSNVSWALLAQDSTITYGAVILSFVGAVHWGMAIGGGVDRSRNGFWYAWSVVPALLAWAALVWLPGRAVVFALLAGFALAWFVDLRAGRAALLPSWYMTLRHRLTAGACLSLVALLFAME